MSDFSLEVSLPGQDVFKATPQQLSIDSAYAPPLVEKSLIPPTIDTTYSTYTFTNSGFNTNFISFTYTSNPPEPVVSPSFIDYPIFTIPVSLSYIPACFMMISVSPVGFPNQNFSLFPNGLPLTASGDLPYTDVLINQTNTTDVVVSLRRIYDTSSGGTGSPINRTGWNFKFKYYLFSTNGE